MSLFSIRFQFYLLCIKFNSFSVCLEISIARINGVTGGGARGWAGGGLLWAARKKATNLEAAFHQRKECFFLRTAIQSQSLTFKNFIFKVFKINQFVILFFYLNRFQISRLDLQSEKVSSILVIAQQIRL